MKLKSERTCKLTCAMNNQVTASPKAPRNPAVGDNHTGCKLQHTVFSNRFIFPE